MLHTDKGERHIANYTGGALSVCPFYIHEAKLSISCEGPDESSGMRICFRSVKNKEEWQRTKCFVFDYELHCPLAMALLIHNDCAVARNAACFSGCAKEKRERGNA